MTIYGRTVGKFCKFQISDSSSALRDIPVNSFGSVGLTYAEQDVTALQEAISSVLNGQGSFSTTISGPFDNSTDVNASTTGNRPALSGSHGVLSGLNGGQVSKTFGIYLGIRADWAAGDPVFGGEKCCLISGYTVDPTAGTYSAKLVVAGNRSEDPAWGVAQLDATT
ncbi:MAG: hypothetical protein NT028_12905 [candidate division Zixibacteria bacterium]|nr:hypothetical protein [candidate division Zixibacteria bacterium]